MEAAALALLAALPVVPYLTFLLRTGVPRFGLFGDFALLEHATRHAWKGETLLGPYSRFHWHHPGPLFFYLVAPFEAAFGEASTGLYVGTCFVNALSAGAIVACARSFATRAHALAALLVVLAWFAAFGNVTANPWNPLAVVLPMMAYLVSAALFARGRSAAAYPSAVFGALVAQMHIAVVTTVVATGAIALAAFLLRGRWRRASPSSGDVARPPSLPLVGRTERKRLAIAAGVLLLLFAPPLVEQVTAPDKGNLTRIVSFFFERVEPHKPLAFALRQWVFATSWLPDRVLARSLLDEGFIPLGMRWDAVPTQITKTAQTMTLLHVAFATVTAAVASWRRDWVTLSILGVGMLANAIAVSALRAVIGVSYHYLVFWTTAGSSVVWIGSLSSIFSAIASALERGRRVRFVMFGGAAAVSLAAAVSTTCMQQSWLSEYPVAPASRPPERDDLRSVYTALRGKLGNDSTPVIHADGAWDMAYATVLELEKDGVEVRVPTWQRWIYAGVGSPDGLAKPLHVWFATSPLPLPMAHCLEPTAKSGDIVMYTATVETIACENRE